jgi:hypothetical protein
MPIYHKAAYPQSLLRAVLIASARYLAACCSRSEVKTSFCEQKEAKKLCPAGHGTAIAKARKIRSFLLLFFQKRSSCLRF